ncbi:MULTISPECIES: helix-turn-helix domain-containing protein [Bacteria]|jgi:transcriptional regulator with XRE-family HTH domain|uniref:helix-turn-helix domain-containing protein n=1 Tax=Bacteria TaxID=2 RepID=UPI0003DF32EE|nr:MULTISPECIES: helix-turn-helix transcriptional regulator [Bacteria]ETO98663.1 DNA-binding helix-turn-helix protein [Bifidobacterium sp. MSTE12]EWC99059.1 DNA-binding helix-turn-helix protein [Actinomyces sp. ICM54]
MTVAAVIKSMARELGISQTELAARARMSRASLSLKLNARRDLTLPEVERLAEVLGITVRDLLNRVERAERERAERERDHAERERERVERERAECTSDLKYKEVEDGKYAIADKPTGVILISAAHGSIYDEDEPSCATPTW